MLKIEKVNLWKYILIAYITSLGFQSLFYFPYFGYKIQLPEIIFLLGSILMGVDFLKKKNSWPIMSTIDIAVIFYMLVVLISSIFNSDINVWIEFLGVLYLCLTFFWIKILLQKIDDKNIFNSIRKAFIICGLLVALFCILGWSLLYFLDIENTLAFIYKNYPYFGDSIRASGFTPSSHMAASFLNIAIVFIVTGFISQNRISFVETLLFLILVLAYLITLAKVVVLLCIVILFFLYSCYKQEIPKYLEYPFKAFWGVCILFYLFAIHFLITPKSAEYALQPEKFKVNYSIAETKDYYIIPTAYSALKYSALLFGKENKWIGIGYGNHQHKLNELKIAEKFPNHIPNYSPHSTYMGAFAELGILGVFAILFLFTSIFNKLKQDDIINIKCWLGIKAIFLLALIEAISTDIMNFRQYWVLLGVLAFIPKKLS